MCVCKRATKQNVNLYYNRSEERAEEEEDVTILEVDDRPVRVPGPLSVPALDALAEKLGIGHLGGAALGQETVLGLQSKQLTSLPAEIGQLV